MQRDQNPTPLANTGWFNGLFGSVLRGLTRALMRKLTSKAKDGIGNTDG